MKDLGFNNNRHLNSKKFHENEAKISKGKFVGESMLLFFAYTVKIDVGREKNR